MLQFLRMQMFLLPAIWSLYQDSGTDTSGGSSETGDATGQQANSGDKGERTFTQAELDRIVKDRLDRAAEAARKEREREAADREAEKLKADQKWQELAEQAQKQADEERKAREDEQQRSRNRIVRSEVKLAAQQHNAIDPDAVYRLLDLDTLTFNADGEPENIDAQVKALLERKPYLIKTAGDGPRGGRETPRPANTGAENPAESFLKSRYGARQQAT